ncbi:cupin domain-containing protein [Ureibacillus terrenus]|uniref:cupin domain-containing protein n=1 Tax=Ureibacillus terrenus TaxID=118246 RepID=UPI002E1FE730|nr:cupin domain-containing protein [Ureibacillus terrenus]
MKVISTPYVLEEKNKQVGKVLDIEKAQVMNIQLKSGESIPSHFADGDVLIIVRRGTVEFTVEEETVELTNETFLHMEPKEKHSLIAKHDADIIVVKMK